MPACTCIRIIKWILILETHDSHKVPCSHQKTPQTNQPSHVGIIKLQLHLHANIERTQLEGCACIDRLSQPETPQPMPEISVRNLSLTRTR